MAHAKGRAGDLVIWGVTASGRAFRPSDWNERLAGLTSAFGQNQKLVYSPLVLPVSVRGVKAVIDRVADKRVVHKNLASRTKSRLAQAIRALA